MKTTLFVLSMLLIAVSCAGKETISKSKAVDLAKAEFERNGRAVQDYQVTVDNDGSGKKWIVWFDAQGELPIPGGKHAVTVEKDTGKVTFMPGE